MGKEDAKSQAHIESKQALKHNTEDRKPGGGGGFDFATAVAAAGNDGSVLELFEAAAADIVSSQPGRATHDFGIDTSGRRFRKAAVGQ